MRKTVVVAGVIAGALVLTGAFSLSPHLSQKHLSVSSRDRDLMIRTVWAEAAREPVKGQIAVAFVIFNRWQTNPFGWKTISDVVTACGYIIRRKRRVKICQFEPWLHAHVKKRMMALSTESVAYRRIGALVDQVLAGAVRDPTRGAFYFLNMKTVTRRRVRQGRAMPEFSKNCPLPNNKFIFYLLFSENSLNLYIGSQVWELI